MSTSIVMARALAWLLGWSAFVPAIPASAVDASVPVRLELAAPFGCVSSRELLEAVQSRNGHARLAAGDEPAVLLRVSVSEGARGLHGELEVRGLDGNSSSRSVDGDSCRAVVEALSLSAALSLQQVAAAPPELLPPPAPPLSAAPVPPALPVAPAAQRSARPEKPQVRFEAGALASLAQVVTPHLNAGAGVLGRARLERGYEPSLSLSLVHTQNELFESSRHVGVRLTGVALTVCPARFEPLRSLHLEPCLTGTGAQLQAFGRELPVTEAVSRSWWGLGALLRLALSPTRDLSIEVEGGALRPLVDRQFVVLPSGASLGKTPALAPFTSAGLVYAL